MNDRMLKLLAEFEALDAKEAADEFELARWDELCTHCGLVTWLAAEYRKQAARISELASRVNDVCKWRDELTLSLSQSEHVAEVIQQSLDEANARITELEHAANNVIKQYGKNRGTLKRLAALLPIIPEPPQ